MEWEYLVDFSIDMCVRDYECDLQGVVNNAIYQNYLEHARHKYLQNLGLHFSELHAEGHDLVITRCEIVYHRPLRSADEFCIGLRVRPEGRIRIVFDQEIRLQNNELVLSSCFVVTCLNQSARPGFPSKITDLIFGV